MGVLQGSAMSSMTISTHSPRRSRALAGLLSLIAPGVGHLYAGRRRRALVIFVVSLLLTPMAFASAILVPPTFHAIAAFGATVLGLVALFLLIVMIDVVRLARRDAAAPSVRWLVLLGAVLAAWGGYYAESFVNPVIKQHLPWRTFSIPSSSMQPTLRVGEWLFADMRYYVNHAPARGDVAVFRLPHGDTTIYLKRVIALPGDRVAFRDNHAIVNDVMTHEPFADFGDGKAFYANTPEVTVPAGQLFVAGDNRSNSSDSRVKQHGMVPLQNLVGRATEIYMTDDWQRAGLWVGSPAS
jgi:signal peptidase I